MMYEGHVRAIYRLGYNADDNQKLVCDDRPKATLFRHANYDYVNNAVVWDPATPDHQLPDSLYLGGKPAWFEDMRWPPINPETAPKTEASSLEPVIPAMRRFGAMPGIAP